MTNEHAKNRLERLRAMVKDQPEKELRTQFASVVAEITRLEAVVGATEERKAKKSRDRKKRTGHDRSE